MMRLLYREDLNNNMQNTDLTQDLTSSKKDKMKLKEYLINLKSKYNKLINKVWVEVLGFHLIQTDLNLLSNIIVLKKIINKNNFNKSNNNQIIQKMIGKIRLINQMITTKEIILITKDIILWKTIILMIKDKVLESSIEINNINKENKHIFMTNKEDNINNIAIIR